MKNLNRAAGALFIGAASLALANSAANAAEGGTKPWTVSASLRGFYDDNIFTAPDGAVNHINSWGFDVSPSLSYARTMGNTSFDLGYTYIARWYEDRPDDKWDHVHNAKVGLSHEFSERFGVALSDNFVSAQDPEQFGAANQLLRAEGDNISNSANVSARIGISETWEATLSYRNNFYDYDSPAYSGALDRIEHLPALDLGYILSPRTSLHAGYQFGIYDYDNDLRDYDSHILYGGVSHAFNQNFSGFLNVGAQITEYDLAGTESDTTPFVDARLAYFYAPTSDISLAVKHTLNATDVLTASNQETTLFQVRWNHSLTAKVKIGAIAQFQSSDFNGLNMSEDYWTLGANIEYSITPHVGLTAAYYHDDLTSDIANRGYDRNRYFLGVRASF